MAFKNILVPTDGSEFTKPAIETAVDTSIYDMMSSEGHKATEYVRQRCQEAGIPVTEKVVDGSPVKAIVDASPNYDIIVMGTLGRTGLAKLMMGSVAERVVRYAHCPVLVVRSPETDGK